MQQTMYIILHCTWASFDLNDLLNRSHPLLEPSECSRVHLPHLHSEEQRFASIVAKRLESLGALTHGDRRATESRDLSKYNLDTKFGHQALEITLKSIAGMIQPSVKSEEYTEEFFTSMLLECLKGCI